MNWATINATIVGVLEDLTKLQVVWKNQPSPFVSDETQAIIRPSIFGSQQIGGADDLRTIQDLTKEGTEITFARVGWRRFTLSVRCDSYSQADGNLARGILETLRTRLDYPSVNDRLDAVNVAYVDCMPCVDLDAPKNSRVVSSASIDFIMSASIIEVDADNPIGYIATVEITSHLTDGGDTLPTPPNYTETVGA